LLRSSQAWSALDRVASGLFASSSDTAVARALRSAFLHTSNRAGGLGRALDRTGLAQAAAPALGLQVRQLCPAPAMRGAG